MKRKERHHLKENELAHSIRAAREFVGTRQREVTGLLVVLLLMAIAIVGITVIRQRTQARAQSVLTDALVVLNARVVPATPQQGQQPGELPPAATIGATGTFFTEEAKLNAAIPKLQTAADAFPDSEPGIQARYRLAASLAYLGRQKEAMQQFEEVEKHAGASSVYGRMAQLGKADAQAQAGELDAAIATWKTLAADKNSDLPQDAILMELARAYTAKGNRQEAQKTFTQLVDEHPDSPYVTEARAQLQSLKG